MIVPSSDRSGAREIPSGLAARGRLTPPPSKSITQRFLNLALLAGKSVVVERALLAEDTRLFLKALKTIGFEIEELPGEVWLRPITGTGAAEVHCGNNGTMLRFLVASLSTVAGRWELDGTARLRSRPIGPLVEALRSLGADIEFLAADGFAPVSIRGGDLRGGEVELDARLSSQFASALVMAATRARQEVVVHLRSLVSAPYLELTREALRAFGANCERLDGSVYRVAPCDLRGGRFEVESDFSAAAYPAAAALLSGGRVELLGVRRGSRQGDRRFFDVLTAMGASIEWGERVAVIEGRGHLKAVDVELGDMPDQVPTLAALAPFAEGTTAIRNVAHLRIKESDRLTAMTAELRRLGAEVDEHPDALVIPGGWSDGPVPAGKVRVETYGDHRIAMSLAVCGLRRPGVIVKQPEVVAKSYPSFWHDLDTLLRP